MKKNIGLMYNLNEIKRKFKYAMILDIYDYQTMKYYTEKYNNDVSIEELEVMLDTINDGNNFINKAQSLSFSGINNVIALLSIVCAVAVACYVALITHLANLGEQGAIFDIRIIMTIIGKIILAYIGLLTMMLLNAMRKNLEFYKLKKVLEITIYIKKLKVTNEKG